MSSIALFNSTFVNEDEITQKLSAALQLTITTDDDIIEEVCVKGVGSRNKLQQALYKKTSVFNEFTLEKNQSIAHLQAVMAERLAQKKDGLYTGFTSLLIPSAITHILKVLLIDTKENRIQRAINSGLSEREATKSIHSADVAAYAFSEFLFNKDPFDKTAYDIVIPVHDQTADEVVALIKTNFETAAVLETTESNQAVNDLAMTAQIQQALIAERLQVEVSTRDSLATIVVNKSVLNFNKLAKKLTIIANTVSGVRGVDIIKGPNYTTSVYRDQQFKLPPKVLLVDDEKTYVQTLSERLVSRNVASYAVYDGQQALDFIGGDQPDIMVLDLKMPGMSGIEVLKNTKKLHPEIEVIILTGHGSEVDKETCMNLGAYAYLQKPTNVEKLSSTINEAHKKLASSQYQ